MISYVIPTRNRAALLSATLRRLDALGEHPGGAEVVIVENASEPGAGLPDDVGEVLPRSGMAVTLVRLSENLGAAARNHGVAACDPASGWIVMLDDDSWVEPAARNAGTGGLEWIERLGDQPRDVAAVMADIHLASVPGRREAGGLPEVFVGCGVAIRREAFVEAGGYDAAMGYYAEEYDLAAKMILAGGRVAVDSGMRVRHAKASTGRDMDVILARLVRNNGWIAQRYAPAGERRGTLREVRSRYRAIAAKESALGGYGRGLVELRRTLREQSRTPMPTALWERFVGLAAAREAIARAKAHLGITSATVVAEGKNAGVVRLAMAEMGIAERADGEAAILGTLSPGPMLDAAEAWMAGADGRALIVPWTAAGAALGLDGVVVGGPTGRGARTRSGYNAA